ncbi:hypothetical protein ACFTRD_03725 [Paenibacillus sp. NPDC056933]|uniref:hypothetical protein n=1 Tax=Paenibacillus sp. NPDC056933 TaxID=3345968 RepID=UPI00362BFAB8
MKKILVKGFLLLTSMLVVLGMLPVGQPTASAETQYTTHEISSEVEISVPDSVYGNDEDLMGGVQLQEGYTIPYSNRFTPRYTYSKLLFQIYMASFLLWRGY